MSKIKLTISFSLLLVVLMCNARDQVPAKQWKLMVSQNGHYIIKEDGTPFFWLGDTGWEMLHRLSRQEIEDYLQNRKEKGFNVIQTVVISEFIHSDREPNYYGDSVLVNDDPERPAVTPGNNPEVSREYDFWDNVDFAVKTAAGKGLYVGLVPSWGEWVVPRTDKALFNNIQQAYNYGWFLGNRYSKSNNIIWILGGDRHPDERPEGVNLWRAMAEGITDGVNGIKKQDGKADYTTTFMTHHAYNSSSTWFHNDGWIDFHMWGSYHAEINNSRAWELALKDWNLSDPKPTINAEPCYEAHGINYAIEDNGYFTSTDVRLAAYWSAFSGAAGFTYGSQPVWQFTDQTRKKHSKMTLTDWQEGLDLPGAKQMVFLKKIMEEIINNDLRPDQSVLTSGEGFCNNRICALRNKSMAYIYSPAGNTITLKMGFLEGEKVSYSWFDPRNGSKKPETEIENKGEKSFEVPAMSEELSWLKTGRGCDWVLILKSK